MLVDVLDFPMHIPTNLQTDSHGFTNENSEKRKHVSIEMRKGRNGKLRSTFYGVYELNGKRHCINLGIDIKGTPPRTMRDTGDVIFERARVKAEEKLAQIVAEAHTSKNYQRILEKIYEHKTGEAVPSVPIRSLTEQWLSIPRSKNLSKKYIITCQAILRRFVQFLNKACPQITDLSDVKESSVLNFLKIEENRGIADKTYNDIVIILKTIWARLLPGFPCPVKKVPKKQQTTLFRKPFTEEQLQKILESAKSNDFIYPIIVTGICTAMRRGDCCLLTWSNVDMQQNFITVKTSKTNAVVEIPIFDLMREVLDKQLANKVNDYVFPQQAEMYLKNPDGITLRVQKTLSDARIFTNNKPEQTASTQRLRKKSEYDFHSFRVTWVTIALTAGISLELVQRVTGHSTVSVVLKHYFHPNRDDFRKVLKNKLPSLLSGDITSSTEQEEDYNLRNKLQEMNTSNWSIIKEEILKNYEQNKIRSII